jgi:nucleoside phosphorylase
MSTQCDFLVVAAFPPELLGLRKVLGDGLRGRIGTKEVCAVSVGVGLVRAGCGTVAALQTYRPRAVVLVGTCGAYGHSGLHKGDVVVARSTRLIEPAVLEGRAAFPAVAASELDASIALADAIAGTSAPVVDVVTTLAVTIDDELSRALGRYGDVEHLETFAVAYACESGRVPFAAVLGVANGVGSIGRTEWASNHEAAGMAAAAFVVDWVQHGACPV